MSLSNQQEKIVNEVSSKEEGNFIVRACPGSGKTFTVAHLLAKENKLWDRAHHGIAVLSFTNAAKNEILKKIKEDVDDQCLIGYPHFIGTIDSFLNQNIFLPFGSEIMGCNKRPILVGEPYGIWNPHSFYQKLCVYISYDINGNKYWLNHKKKPNGYNNDKERVIFYEKEKFTKEGFANQNDANYFSYKILRENSEVARLLAARYPYIILDEAQDTSEMQMAIIDIMIENGVKKIVLVGDPDQAIYEWNQARPDLFLDKINSEQWISRGLDLVESFRSSEKICSFASKFSVNKFQPADNNEVGNFSESVRILSWKLEDIENGDFSGISSIVQEFEDKCYSIGIDVNCEKIAVLARGIDLLTFVKGQELSTGGQFFDWGLCEKKYTKDACLSKYHYENGNFSEACKSAIKWCVKAVHPQKEHPSDEDYHSFTEIERDGFNAVFKGSMIACHFKLPSVKVIPDVGDWLAQPEFSDSSADKFKGITFDDIFFKHKKNEHNEKIPLYSTIHGIKGATFDAVLLFLKKKGGKGNYYKTNLVKGFNLDDKNMEEMRNVYVAITRPRKILWIAVPECDYGDWENFSKI